MNILMKKRTSAKRLIALVLAFTMIISPLSAVFHPKPAKAAGAERVEIPGTGKLSLSDNFDVFYKNMENRDAVGQGTIAESKDGSDNVTLALKANFVGELVSKEQFDMLHNDFDYIGSITMVNGTNPAVRGMAFAFHNDPRGREALGEKMQPTGFTEVIMNIGEITTVQNFEML